MGRSSREVADQKREEVIAGASQLFREQGVDRGGIAEIMRAAGMTHGAFYSHFTSKEALAAEACEYAFSVATAKWHGLLNAEGADAAGVREGVLAKYLSASHRDDPATGCPGAALASDAARDAPDGLLRKAYVAGLKGMSGAVERMMPASLSAKMRRKRALRTIATALGAITIARAVKGDPLADEILEAVREEMLR
ncbi:TetR family transcriptional regulator [Oxalobacteraceae bacterium CAVE-383]|nr:TetR family transcriptional regulator [Oxalobacteraceae bacterium CAVE-383]